MRDVLEDLIRWWRSGQTVGLATVVGTWQSAPRTPGAAMLVDPAGEVTGSVSGGCVEAAVYQLAVDPDQPATLQRYGVSDEEAFAVGLTCGGLIDIFIQRISSTTFPEFDQLVDAIGAGVPVAVVTCVGPDGSALVGRRLVVRADRVVGSLGRCDLDALVAAAARRGLAAARTDAGQTSTMGRGPAGEPLTFFVDCYVPAPRMIVFGAVDFAAALSRIGSFLGFEVTVCDARAVFATERRFPDAAEVVVDWPHRYLLAQAQAGRVDERTVLCVLTHDPKFDVPLLEVALRLPVAYVGAMGSRRSHHDRMQRLRVSGLSEAELAALHSPIGLDLGAGTPQETAISITAEILAEGNGGSGRRLTDCAGRIHRLGSGSRPGGSGPCEHSPGSSEDDGPLPGPGLGRDLRSPARGQQG